MAQHRATTDPAALRIPMISGDEADYLSPASARWHRGPGKRRTAKRSYSRRLRHRVRAALRAQAGE